MTSTATHERTEQLPVLPAYDNLMPPTFHVVTEPDASLERLVEEMDAPDGYVGRHSLEVRAMRRRAALPEIGRVRLLLRVLRLALTGGAR